MGYLAHSVYYTNHLLLRHVAIHLSESNYVDIYHTNQCTGTMHCNLMHLLLTSRQARRQKDKHSMNFKMLLAMTCHFFRC